jgi:hypothetical protein
MNVKFKAVNGVIQPDSGRHEGTLLHSAVDTSIKSSPNFLEYQSDLPEFAYGESRAEAGARARALATTNSTFVESKAESLQGRRKPTNRNKYRVQAQTTAEEKLDQRVNSEPHITDLPKRSRYKE